MTASLPSLTRWNLSTETAARGSESRRALRNAAEGSIATISIRSRHSSERSASQLPTEARSRGRDDTEDLSGGQVDQVVIQGSNRRQPPSVVRNHRTDR